MTAVVLPLERVVFDDTARAAAAAAAAAAYLDAFCLFGGGGSGLVRPELAQRFLDAGGFEDPNELTWALVFYFLTALAPPLRPMLRVVSDEDDVRTAFRAVGLRFGELIGRAEYDPGALLERVASRGGGVEGLRLAVGGDSIETFILPGAIRRAYHDEYVGRGLFLEDAPRVQRAELASLRSEARIAIVTSLPTEVAQGLLMRHGLLGSQDGLHCADQVGRPLLPSLLHAALGARRDEAPCFVVCPTVAMVRAALDTAAVPIGLALTPAHRRPLTDAGCRAVVSKLERLVRVLKRGH